MMGKIETYHTKPGFTIVELVIVVIVIAVLATISIVAFNGIQDRARRATTLAELNTLTKQIEIYKIDHNDTYPADLTSIKYGSGYTVQYTYTAGTNNYCVTISNTTAELYDTDTTDPQDGYCPGHTSYLASAPAPPPAILENWALIETGGDTTCGLYVAVPYCWGANDFGQMGNGSTGTSVLPTGVTTSGVLSGKTVTQMSVGVYNICVLTSDAKSFCSGMGARGQLGRSSVADSSAMVAPTLTGVLSGKTILKITAGNQFTCAIASNNAAYCWGLAGEGQLGINSTSNATAPSTVVATGVLSGKTMTEISSGYDHTCALDSTGKAYCWGRGTEGQLGNGTTPASSLVPVAVTSSGVLSGKTLTKIRSGFRNVCALSSDSLLFCWGNNASGQFGNSLTANTSTAIQVPMTGVLSGKTISDFSLGASHTCVLTTEGKTYCTGANASGQLGNNSTTSSTSFVAVDTSTALSGKTVSAISHGLYSNHTCVLTSQGQSFCWGTNGRGQFGNNTTSSASVPTLTTHP